MEILVLKKNDKLGIDKDRESYGYMSTYMLRECVEVIRAVHEAEYMGEDLKEIAGEVFDVLQCCVGMLDKLCLEGRIDIEEEALKHKEKLIGRGWEVKKIIYVD